MGKRVSLVVLNHNGKRHLKEYFDSVFKQTRMPDEIFMTDTVSIDGSIEFVKNNYPKVKIIKNVIDKGPGVDSNIAFKHTTGDYVVFQSNDIKMDKNCIKFLVETLDEDKNVGICTSVYLYFTKDKIKKKFLIENAGGAIDVFGFNWPQYNAKSIEEIPTLGEVFLSYGGSFIIRNSLFKKLKGYDERYFALNDDVDLSWRARLLGYKIMYNKKSIIYHKGHGTLGSRNRSLKRYWSERNCLRTILKNYSVYSLRKYLPGYFLILFGEFIWHIISGKFLLSHSIIKAVAWNILYFPETLYLRKKIQLGRKVSDQILFSLLYKESFKLKYMNEPKYYRKRYMDNILTGMEEIKQRLSNRRFLTIILIITTIGVRIVPAMYTPLVADLWHWWKTAISVLDGINPYIKPRGMLYPYPPVWMYIEAAAAWLSITYNLSFQLIIKIPLILSDVFISIFIFRSAYINDIKKSFFAGLLYGLNPISILITGFHGQFDTLAIAAIVLAVYLFKKQRSLLAGISLGVGIAIKSFPILLLPIFLIRLPGRSGRKIQFVLLTFLPVSLLLIPFMAKNFAAVYQSLLSYSGWTDQGWMAAFRAFYWLTHNAIYTPVPFINSFLTINKIIFLCLYMVLIICCMKNKKRSIVLDVSTVFCLFYFIFGGISTQYLIWALPFLILTGLRNGIVYSIFASLTTLGYYTFFVPRLILWAIPFISISHLQELEIKKSIFSTSGNLSAVGSISLPIKLALLFHLLSTTLFWLFIGLFLVKSLLPSISGYSNEK